ncbi:hypothetical protein SAMN04490178_12733 [Propionispora vibrioides]|uniref:Uncharacterized protein n=1 Tax=Propionispora vibrioides TaxID=112903 RepID=A0A1H8XPE6_9FIRM|nr:hypothetical protein SAMN04490178_12733 [Propionispora vibrioides]
MRRYTPDGELLSWHLTNPMTIVANGIISIFIDWGTEFFSEIELA